MQAHDLAFDINRIAYLWRLIGKEKHCTKCGALITPNNCVKSVRMGRDTVRPDCRDCYNTQRRESARARSIKKNRKLSFSAKMLESLKLVNTGEQNEKAN